MTNINSICDSDSFFSAISFPSRELLGNILRHKGARIGESTVVSRSVHNFNPSTPEEVHIVTNVDAGIMFYQKKLAGQVYHLDTFHQLGEIEPELVASCIKHAIDKYNHHTRVHRLLYDDYEISAVNADVIDIQTGKGGGRVTGNLKGGKKTSICRAHKNHVHVAAALTNTEIDCLFYITAAVEEAVLASNLELRRNEKIIIGEGNNPTSNEMNPYRDDTDSFLQEDARDNISSKVKNQQIFQDIQTLSEKFDDINDMKDTLDKLSQAGQNSHSQNEKDKDIAPALRGLGIVKGQGLDANITKYGRELLQFLKNNMLSIQSFLRQSMYQSTLNKRSLLTATTAPAGITLSNRKVDEINNTTGEFIVSETILAAARRTASSKDLKFHIAVQDIRKCLRNRTKKMEICLLVDASQSMEGKRIKAAKLLARQLIQIGADRICIMTFQNDRSTLEVPLTRNLRMVEEKLMSIQVGGLTPMGLGITTCLEYLAKEKVHRPLIVLITDGLPTKSMTRDNPTIEALRAAEGIKSRKYRFICIGLKPYRDFLATLAQHAGGQEFIMDELEIKGLFNIVLKSYINHQQ